MPSKHSRLAGALLDKSKVRRVLEDLPHLVLFNTVLALDFLDNLFEPDDTF
jgi:hypothetical protein